MKIWDLNVDSALLRTFKTGYCGFCNAATDVNTVSHEWKDVVITPSRETCEILFCDIRMSGKTSMVFKSKHMHGLLTALHLIQATQLVVIAWKLLAL